MPKLSSKHHWREGRSKDSWLYIPVPSEGPAGAITTWKGKFSASLCHGIGVTQTQLGNFEDLDAAKKAVEKKVK